MSRDPAELDRSDPLAPFRSEFHLPDGKIYLDGNSLGLMCRRAEAALEAAATQWRTGGIQGWLEGAAPWLTLADTAAEMLAPLVGGAAGEICVTGQTTANLHQLLATLYEVPGAPCAPGAGVAVPSSCDHEHACDHPHDARGPGGGERHAHEAAAAAPLLPTRSVIVGDALNFASDTYALDSHLRLRGLDPAVHLRLIPSRDGRILRLDDILAAFTPDVQIAVLPSVVFTSGQLLDVPTISRKARERGILLGWDLSHSVGVVPHALDRDGVDFAFWSSYKWLNGGPGAVGGLYLNRRHFGRAPGLAGWWGVRPQRRFALARVHEPPATAAALQIGTPHILSLAPLLGSLEVIRAAGIEAIRAKSLALTELAIAQADAQLRPLGFSVVTPRGAPARGGHIALAHPDAWRISQAWKAAGVIPDFRPPDLIRLAPSPLYTRFTECADALARLQHVVASRAHEHITRDTTLVP